MSMIVEHDPEELHWCIDCGESLFPCTIEDGKCENRGIRCKGCEERYWNSMDDEQREYIEHQTWLQEQEFGIPF